MILKDFLYVIWTSTCPVEEPLIIRPKMPWRKGNSIFINWGGCGGLARRAENWTKDS